MTHLDRDADDQYAARMDVVRAAWVRFETIHAVTYFAEESRHAAAGCGLRGFWMGYFGFRAAPLGAVQADVVESAFYNFAPRMVQRSIPDAWTFAEPRTLIDARTAAASAALRRLCPAVESVSETAMAMLADATHQASDRGRPLYAANRQLDHPSDRVGRLWQDCTTLREQRGDSHVAALRAAGLDGCAAHVLLAADHGVPAEVEAATDASAREALAPLIDSGRLVDLVDELDPIAHDIAASAVIPYPNPMGLPDVQRHARRHETVRSEIRRSTL